MKKQFPIILFIVIVILAFLVIQPFIKSLLFAAILAYVFYPVKTLFKKKIKNKNLTATIITIIILLLAIIPSAFVAQSLVKESYSTYLFAKQRLLNSNVCESGEGFICNQWNNFEQNVLETEMNQYIKSGLESFSSKAITGIYDFIKGIAESMMQIFMFVILLFFLLRDGDVLMNKIYNLIPFKKKDRDETIKEVSNMLYAVVYGSIMIALIQGALAFIGFWLFGISNPFLWGLIVVFAAFVPFLGATLAWLPITLINLGDAVLGGEKTAIWKGVFLFLYCLVIVSGIDDVLKPKIIGQRSKLHPALVFLGVIGGLYLMGPIGVFIGPVIMALFVVFIKIYEKGVVKK
ncbi:MAG: AI-2E family transporter [Nanoarchaeota archaeon]|nr:AI-2E family transporter [Nanoarchaeota archaeon]